jgi:hypothetical protein
MHAGGERVSLVHTIWWSGVTSTIEMPVFAA